MKKICLYSVRFYIKLGLFFYFRKIHIYGIKNIPKGKPILFLANHQNALLDALLIATNCDRLSYFLTRAGVFKKAFVSKLLASLQMLPVYRIRDGWSNITNNNAIFETCTELLNNKEAIVIFPEGSHNLARRVRPLSKGFTRIVFDTLEKYPNTDLQLIPVGLNFQKAEKFPDSASLFFGKPITAKDFISENKNDAIVSLKSRIHLELSKLTTHIPLIHYDDYLEKLNILQVDYLKPQDVNTCISKNFKNCESKKKAKATFIKSFLKVLLIINLAIPYLLWKLIIEPKIEEIEFKSTFRFAVAITLVPFWVLLVFTVLGIYFGWIIASGYLLFVLSLTLLSVKA